MEDHDEPTGKPPEPVEERPFVGEVTPEDYPEEKRAESNPNGAVDNRDALKPNEWDRSGAGEIGSGDTSTVGASPQRQDVSDKTN